LTGSDANRARESDLRWVVDFQIRKTERVSARHEIITLSDVQDKSEKKK